MRNFRTLMWGLFFILAGVLMTINQFTDMNIPVFRTLFGIFVMFIGLSILFKGKDHTSKGHKKEAVFEESYTSASENEYEKYSAVFGKQLVDATSITLDTTKRIKFEVVFGEGTLLLDPYTPTIIKADAAFGAVHLPDYSQVNFGTRMYEFAVVDRNAPHLEIHANSVFGKLNIVYRKNEQI